MGIASQLVISCRSQNNKLRRGTVAETRRKVRHRVKVPHEHPRYPLLARFLAIQTGSRPPSRDMLKFSNGAITEGPVVQLRQLASCCLFRSIIESLFGAWFLIFGQQLHRPGVGVFALQNWAIDPWAIRWRMVSREMSDHR